MTLNNLHDVYQDQLQDLYSACKQSLDATTEAGSRRHRQRAERSPDRWCERHQPRHGQAQVTLRDP